MAPLGGLRPQPAPPRCPRWGGGEGAARAGGRKLNARSRRPRTRPRTSRKGAHVRTLTQRVCMCRVRRTQTALGQSRQRTAARPGSPGHVAAAADRCLRRQPTDATQAADRRRRPPQLQAVDSCSLWQPTAASRCQPPAAADCRPSTVFGPMPAAICLQTMGDAGASSNIGLAVSRQPLTAAAAGSLQQPLVAPAGGDRQPTGHLLPAARRDESGRWAMLELSSRQDSLLLACGCAARAGRRQRCSPARASQRQAVACKCTSPAGSWEICSPLRETW